MVRKKDIHISLSLTEHNRLEVTCEPIHDFSRYAFYLYHGDEIVDRIFHSEKNKALFWLGPSGQYTVRVSVKEGEESVSNYSEEIEYHRFENSSVSEDKSPRTGFFKKILLTTRELVGNMSMTMRVAKFDYMLQNKDSYLGRIWSVLTPLIQIATYWLVFGMGLRGNRNVDGFPFLLWMLCGLVPWFYINESILKGANSIYSKSSTVTKMKYPIATVPIGVVTTAFLEHAVVFLMLMILFMIKRHMPTLYLFNIIYYELYCYVFLCSLALITSTLTMLARDFQKMLTSMIRLIFYLTPILWSMDNMPELYQTVVKYTPVYYVIRGFRESFLYQTNFWMQPGMCVYFWGLNLVLFAVGCILQYDYRKRFNDLV